MIDLLLWPYEKSAALVNHALAVMPPAAQKIGWRIVRFLACGY